MLANKLEYTKDYKNSIDDPEKFWAAQANKYVTWFKQWHMQSGEMALGNIRWLDGAELNVSYNCLDRHLIKKVMLQRLFGRAMKLAKTKLIP